MRKFLIRNMIAADAMLAFSFTAGAQEQDATDARVEEYAGRYSLLVSKLGVDGVGIETVLNNWAALARDVSIIILPNPKGRRLSRKTGRSSWGRLRCFP